MNLVPPLLSRTGPLARAVLGLCGGAALAAHFWPVRIVAAPSTLPPKPPAAAPPTTGEAVLGRPLFDPGRRPWTARGDRTLVLAPDPVRPVLTVRGIMIDSGTSRALIDDGGSGARAWLSRGEGRGGWRIAEIGPNRVTLDQGGQLFTAEFLGRPATLRPAPLQAVPASDAPALRR